MELVIKIPDGIYDFLKEHPDRQFPYATEWVRQGSTPLPKGHGDLKDIGNIRLEKFCRIENISLNPRFSEEFKKGYNAAIDDVWNVLREAPTIIEADKEEE